MTAWIDPTAVVDPAASLADDVEVGPYSIIGPHVSVGAGTKIGPHVVIEGRTTIGARNRFYSFSSVGAEPQDQKYKGEPTELHIGDDNVIREFTTLHLGTEGGGGSTSIANRNLLMNFSHVAHDCHLGSHAILANGATLAGHVTVEDFVIVGGLAAVHQFTKLGESSMLGGGAMVVQDVPPFCTVQGDRARLVGLNVEGLRRRGFSSTAIRSLRTVYRELFHGRRPTREAIPAMRSEHGGVPEVARFLDFLEAAERGVCRPRRESRSDEDEG